MTVHFAGVLEIFRRNRSLIVQLARRDITQRYKDSVLGVAWIIGQPLLQLMLYGFVFQVVLRSRWGLTAPNGEEVPFGLILFVGILIHTLLAETLVRGPALILSNTTYVKRVIFPLEILPVVNVLSSLVSFTFGFGVLLIATFIFVGHVSSLAWLAVVPVAFLAIMTLGIGWALSALGVYLRDLGQITGTLSSVLLFTAPICFPASMVPTHLSWLLQMNPLTIPVNAVRALVFGSSIVSAQEICIYGVVSMLIAMLGYFLFTKMRAGFADVL
ncbi:ABC transporter permease [Niveibacterium sp. SC-1]|uniref:ABC transporter permease n=1 Tax=Niveibacterium sp. SC-1 TaxID=3135646 RepID=UPI00311FAADD